ncbi:pseudaminic acid synthase [Vogesella fluminis]|uniref:Pseudaminic acid synthase n=1 Tax=Vogesella fluminis TaxID=1069161 RepID=A0ABQ3HBH7_9NEIS|nr:pseudaminic acid synthase [Vogesella fluminis]GHD79195.1 pseudaminic acid synthase [Vogesella fluminis]
MKLPVIEISGRKIGAGFPPYVVAEMSANHNGSLERAFATIRAAKAAGADAVKLQTYTADMLTLDIRTEDFAVQGGLWDGQNLYDLYSAAQMPLEWHPPLFEYAANLGITLFSTPFAESAVDLLEDLNAPAYKIASCEIVDVGLIRYAASTGKPLIISTGMASVDDIHEAIAAAYDGGCRQLAILHCVSGYPAPATDYNLRTLLDMQQRFGHVVGLSDHTLESATAVASVVFGAALIEKHFTLDHLDGGVDEAFSLDPSAFASLCRDVKTAWQALGQVDYAVKSSEQGNLKFRRSLYFVKDLQPGDLITPDAVRSVRPAFGLAPKYLASILGCRLVQPVTYGCPVTWEVLDKTAG